jgi:hypothetical protein
MACSQLSAQGRRRAWQYEGNIEPQRPWAYITTSADYYAAITGYTKNVRQQFQQWLRSVRPRIVVE